MCALICASHQIARAMTIRPDNSEFVLWYVARRASGAQQVSTSMITSMIKVYEKKVCRSCGHLNS